jgi:hypothetical protein
MSDGLKILLGALVGAIVVLLFGSILGGGSMMGSMGSMMGGGLFGMLFALLFWVALVALSSRWLSGSSPRPSSAVSPREPTRRST